MNQINRLTTYQTQVLGEVVDNILPFYQGYAVDKVNGGFHGLICRNREIVPDAPKGLIQHARGLWSFAHAYRILGDDRYREMADWAYDALLSLFWDAPEGGFYWMITHDGQPLDANKVTYGQAFGIYALAEYAYAMKHEHSYETAIGLYEMVEWHLTDPVHGGYFEGGLRDWSISTDVSLDGTQAAKSMNTHLHVMEAYTSLLRVCSDASVRTKLKALIDLHLSHILDGETGHFKLHFTPDWQSLNAHISYGHDIEGSWLLVEAAEALDDHDLLEAVHEVSLRMAQAVYESGLDERGATLFEGTVAQGVTNRRVEWWAPAEAMVGFLNAYQLSGMPHFLNASLKSWDFIQTYIVDREYGDWIWGLNEDGSPDERQKTGPWKSAYHSSRACLEVYKRLKTLDPSGV